MNVSDNVKKAYQSNSIAKHITLSFPELNKEIGTEKVYFETMQLYESILEEESIEFVGCIASKFSIQVYGITEDIKGKKISVKVHTDGTEDEPISLFNGVVDSALMQSNKKYKKIIAYDELYTKGNVNVAGWYNALPFPVTIKDMRDSLFEYIDIEQVKCDLPNDSVEITQMYDPVTLNALDVIKSICQINGAFGIINRDGKFEYRYLSAIGENKESISYYKSIDYEEFTVNPVDKLTIRQSENEIGVSYGEGTNNYIIQGNILAYGLDEATLLQMAENIYEKVCNVEYHPFTSDNNGLPWIECGANSVEYQILDTGSMTEYVPKVFYVFSRELTGLQAMRDSYSANGEEYQTEFITDVNAQITALEMAYNDLVEQQFVVYTYQNISKYEVTSAKETKIIQINYSAVSNTEPVFISTIPVTMDSDGNLILRYYIDAVLMSQDTLTKYLPRGTHFVTISNFFTIAQNRRATLTVTAQMEYFESDERKHDADISALIEFAETGTYTEGVISETAPTATIAANTIRAMLFANGLATTEAWDGTINFSDTVPDYIITGRAPVTVESVSESLNISTQIPTTGTASDTVGDIAVSRGKIEIIGYSIAMNIEESE